MGDGVKEEVMKVLSPDKKLEDIKVLEVNERAILLAEKPVSS